MCEGNKPGKRGKRATLCSKLTWLRLGVPYYLKEYRDTANYLYYLCGGKETP